MSATPSVNDLALSPGMQVSVGADGSYRLVLGPPIGEGEMRGFMASPGLFCFVVDFSTYVCPNITARGTGGGWLAGGTWFSVNYCTEGRCEVLMDDGGYALVKSGDTCASYSDVVPDEFHYPMGRYRGVEVYVRTDLADEPAFALLREAGVSLDGMARDMGMAALFGGDAQLNASMEAVGRAVRAHDTPRAKLAVLDALLTLSRRDLAGALPHTLLTRGQMGIARAAHDRVLASLAEPYDVAHMAKGFGISSSTLNGYFSDVYGATIPAFVRQARMEAAAGLLREGATVAQAAASVGYANPSKFATAFRGAFGVAPSEYRLRSSV